MRKQQALFNGQWIIDNYLPGAVPEGEVWATPVEWLGRTAKQAIGYKELNPYFSGEKTLDDCIDNLKMQTRRYAKRQLTWFRRDEKIRFVNIDEYSDSESLVEAVIGIIGEEEEKWKTKTD